MAPILFDIVIDALHELLTEMTAGFNANTINDKGEPHNEALHSLAFADDISTYSEKIDDLQQKHDIVELFADILDFSINMQKTVLIASEGEGRPQPPDHLNPDQLFARNKDHSLNKLTAAGKWSNEAAAEPSRRRTPTDAVIVAKDGSKTIAIKATEQNVPMKFLGTQIRPDLSPAHAQADLLDTFLLHLNIARNIPKERPCHCTS